MYRKQAVDVPAIKGKIAFLKSGSATYVYYQTGVRIYNKEKKYTSAKRSAIGKLCPEDAKKMYPNEKYFELFPNVPYVETTEEPKRSYSLKVGNYILIKKIIEELNLREILSSQFKEEDLNILLDLAVYGIITENNAGQYYPMYAYEHAVFTSKMRVYSDCKVSRWLHAVNAKDIINTLNEWNNARNHKDPVYISYDSTNKNSQAGDVEFVEYGASKVDNGLPIINYSLAYDTKERLPLFYESYPGSIPDVAQLHYTIEKTKEYKYQNIGFILDRGYFSEENIADLDKNKYPFIIMVKGRKKLIRAIAEEKLHTFEKKSRNYIEEYDVFGCTVKRKLFENDTVDRYIHLYHDSSKEAAELAKFNEELRKMRMEMDKRIGQCTDFPKSYSKFFNLYHDKVEEKVKGDDGKEQVLIQKKFVAYAEIEDAVERERNLCGYFSIVTSREMTARDALLLYKSRDASEKVFRGDKSYLGDKSLRVYTSESTEAKVFVEFFALVIRSRLYSKLHDYNLSLPNKVNFLTVPAAVRELEKIIMNRYQDNKYHLAHAVTKTQKTILAAFGLTADDITEEAEKITEMLRSAEQQEESKHGKTEETAN